MATTADAEATAARALRDLGRADEEIDALQDLLHAHERRMGVRLTLVRSGLK